MESEVRMREASEDDVPGLDIVRRQAIETGFTDAYDRDDFADLVAEPDTNLSGHIDDENTIVLLIESELTAFSYGVLDVSNSELLGLYTAENYQNEGHATKILTEFLSHLRDTGANKLTVKAPKNSVEFFESQGFKRLEETVHDVHGFELLIMGKTLK